MAAIDVLAGDFPQGRAEFGFGVIAFPKKPKQGFSADISLRPKDDLLHIEITTESEESRVGKAAEAGIAGGLLFGGAGLIVGGLMGAANKQKKTVTFKAVFTEGRSLLGKTDAQTFEKLQAFAFNNAEKLPPQEPGTHPTSGDDDVLSRLERLSRLKEQGILNEEEFQQQKAKLLAS